MYLSLVQAFDILYIGQAVGQLKEEIIVKVTKRNKELNEYVQGEVSAMRKRNG